MKEQKEKGLIKHWGFSFHADPELLDQLLTEHPDAEFVQLQINYQDWEDEDKQARANYEVARKHGKPVIIMEPIKGGSLANPPENVAKILKEGNPDNSYAEWALRFAASLEGIMTVLSGMSNSEQMAENLSFMKDFKALDEEERETIKRVQQEFGNTNFIPCTACHYCTDGCPQGIAIPDIFSARNEQLLWGQIEKGKEDYLEATADGARASDCIECGQCESACPQQLNVIELLKESARVFE